MKIRTALLNMSLLQAAATPTGILVFALRAGTPPVVSGPSSPRVVSVTSSMWTSTAAGAMLASGPNPVHSGSHDECKEDRSKPPTARFGGTYPKVKGIKEDMAFPGEESRGKLPGDEWSLLPSLFSLSYSPSEFSPFEDHLARYTNAV